MTEELEKYIDSSGQSDKPDYDEWEADDARRVRECSERGLVIRYPLANELLIDIDSNEQFAICETHIKRLGSLVLSFEKWPSPSKREGRFHVSVTLSRSLKSDHERVLLQALLGSDPMRELLSCLRLEAGMPNATIFFESAEV